MVFSDVAKNTLLKNIDMYRLNLLNFIYIVVFDVKATLENAKLAILQRLELWIFFAPSQPWSGMGERGEEGRLRKFP